MEAARGTASPASASEQGINERQRMPLTLILILTWPLTWPFELATTQEPTALDLMSEWRANAPMSDSMERMPFGVELATPQEPTALDLMSEWRANASMSDSMERMPLTFSCKCPALRREASNHAGPGAAGIGFGSRAFETGACGCMGSCMDRAFSLCDLCGYPCGCMHPSNHLARRSL